MNADDGPFLDVEAVIAITCCGALKFYVRPKSVLGFSKPYAESDSKAVVTVQNLPTRSRLPLEYRLLVRRLRLLCRSSKTTQVG